MKLKLLVWVGCLTLSILTGAEVPAEIEDARITPLNKLPPRGNQWPHPEVDLKQATGRIQLHTTPMPGATPQVEMKVFDPSGKQVAAGADAVELDNVKLWTDGSPQRYAIEVSVKSAGKTVPAFRLPLGFRKLEVAGQEIHFNGHPLKIRGVNRHEFFPQTGYVPDEALMRRDIELMKQANINFVRNAHYPCDPRWCLDHRAPRHPPRNRHLRLGSSFRTDRKARDHFSRHAVECPPFSGF
jgi:hypothetical protein